VGRLHTIEGHLQFTHRSGFYVRGEIQWYHQNNTGHDPTNFDPPFPENNFAQENLFLGYRALRRRMDVAFGVLNLGGHDYSLNPLNVYNELPRSRVYLGRLRFSF
jgi:hypothetical protein